MRTPNVTRTPRTLIRACGFHRCRSIRAGWSWYNRYYHVGSSG
jgi:hypothetical protein